MGESLRGGKLFLRQGIHSLSSIDHVETRIKVFMSGKTYSYIYVRLLNNSSPEERAYLERLYSLCHKYVEVWTSGYKNLGARSIQRAKSFNNSFKQHLESNRPLVDLFRALKR